jgi:drug/metabolite transporter (DMT)-like permease
MRLSRGHIRWVYWSSAVLFSTGVLWLVFHYFVHVRGEFGDRPHALEAWWLRLHGAAAMVVLIVLGSLLPIHVRRGWHQRRNLLAGVILSVLATLLIASGYALYYFGGEEARPLISAVHWLFGLAAPLLLVWHIWRGRKQVVHAASSAHQGTDGHPPIASTHSQLDRNYPPASGG